MMRRLLFFATFLLVGFTAFVQPSELVAVKGSYTPRYSVGGPLRLLLQSDSMKKAKGFYQKANGNHIYLRPFNANDTALLKVPVTSIVSITKLYRQQRKSLLIVAGIGIGITGAIVLASHGSVTHSPMGFVAFLPAAASGFLIVYGLPLTYIAEFFNKKNKNRRWHFETR